MDPLAAFILGAAFGFISLFAVVHFAIKAERREELAEEYVRNFGGTTREAKQIIRAHTK